jgi:hypothetical protein
VNGLTQAEKLFMDQVDSDGKDTGPEEGEISDGIV